MIFLLATFLAVGSFVGGILMAQRRRAELKYLVPFALAAVLFRIVLIASRPWDIRMFPFDVYSVVEMWWVVPFAFFLFGAGAGWIKTPVLQDTLLVAQGMALMYFACVAWGESFSDLDILNGKVGTGGSCVQSSNFSCGSAAAAAFLHSHGIETTEREMAYECGTTQFFGTSLAGMVRGIARKVPNGRSVVRVEEISYSALKPPALVIVSSSIVNHWVIVDRLTPDEVQIRDPAGIESRVLSREAFEKRWIGLAVWVDR